MVGDSRILIVFLAAYLLGCFCGAYYLVRWKTGQDIRTLHSGTAGARNSGRVLGKTGFALSLAIDILKAVAAVALAHWLLPGDSLAEMAALLGVLLGHVFPFQLGFRGGKGVAVLIGGTLMINPPLLLAVGLVAGMLAMLLRRSNQSTVIAMLVLPFAAGMLCDSRATIMGFTVLALLVLFFHRRNIHDLIKLYDKGRS
jgi:acyl phosphate:glycerol-3-phosphate acyltransferase